jgi:formate/nitrite transporter FocA (FNT family)
MAKENSALGVLAGETRDYVNLAIDEVKLKTTRGLSTALGQILSWLIIIAVLSLVLGLLSLALLQWINGLVGSPWGTLIVAAVFGLALLILFLNRQKLFRDMFVKLFIDVFYDTDDDEQ